MTEIIDFLLHTGDKIGHVNFTLLLLLILFIGIFFSYRVFVITEGLSHSSLSDLIQYRKFQVVATSPAGNKITFIIRAWGRINAIEKAAKKMDDFNGFTFETSLVTKETTVKH